MAQITITSILWDNPQPDGYLVVMVAYRLTSMPDIPSSYILVSTGTFVSASGVFFYPVVIDNLDITEQYTVRVTSLCGGYSAYRNFVYDPDAAFSLGFSLGFES
jgi:hypothetical protein